MPIQWDDENPKNNIIWDEDVNTKGLINFGKNVVGSTEAVLTAPIRFAFGAGGALGGAGYELATGGGLDRAANRVRENLSDAFSKGFITDKGQEAMEALGHYIYEKPKEFYTEGPYKESDDLAAQNEAEGIRGLAFDVVGTALGMGLPRGRGSRGITPEQERFVKEMAKTDIKPSSEEPAVYRRNVERDLSRREVNTEAFKQPEFEFIEDTKPKDITGAVQGEMFDKPLPKGTIEWDVGLEKAPESLPEAPRGSTIDFPLRQEVLDSPEGRKLVEDYRRWVKDAEKEGNTALATELRNDFAEVMRQYGVDKPADAFKRPLYESQELTGLEQPKLPLETTERPNLTPKSEGYNPIIDPDQLRVGGQFASRPEKGIPFEIEGGNTAVWNPKTNVEKTNTLNKGTFGQSGGVNWDFSRFRAKEINIEDALRVALNQREQINNAREYTLQHLDVARREGNLSDQKGLLKQINRLEAAQKLTDRNIEKIQEVLAKPKASVLGETRFGKSQRGSFSLKDDPEFNKFKNRLPVPFQKNAPELYKTYQKTLNETKEGQYIPAEKQSLEVTKQVPGLDKALRYIAPETELWSDGQGGGIRSKLFDADGNPLEKDITWKGGKLPIIGEAAKSFGRGMTPGAMLTAFAKNSTAIKYVGEIVNAAKTTANKNKFDWLLNEKDGLHTLIEGLKNRTPIWNRLVSVEGKYDMSADMLRNEGFSDKEIAVATKLRESLNFIYDGIDARLKELGRKPIERRLGYLPGVFGGDFQFYAFTKDGKIVGRYGSDIRVGANWRRDKLIEKYPDVIFKEVEHKPLPGKNLADINATWKEMLEATTGDDPLQIAIAESFAALVERQPYEFMGMQKHFMPKKKEAVKGAYGFNQEWMSPEKNAREGFQATLKYIEHAFDWLEMQKAGSKIREVLSDPAMQMHYPETMKYINLYWDVASGRGTKFSNALNAIEGQVAQFTGIGESLISEITRGIKSALTISYLTTPTFAVVQAWQPVQKMPQWIVALNSMGLEGNIPLASAKATLDLGALLSKKGGYISEIGMDAFEWASGEHRLDSYILDDIRERSPMRIFPDLRDSLGWPLRKIEAFSRATVYMNMVHFLHSAGMTPGKYMYETAMNVTNMVMTDYRMHERPLAYQLAGVIGEAASTLTAFKHNDWGQLFAFSEKDKRAGLPVLLGMTIMSTGLMGFYGRDEIDALLEKYNEYIAPYTEFRIPTVKEVLMKLSPNNWSDFISFGGISSITGGDFSSRLSSSNPIPDSLNQTIFPYAQDVASKIIDPLKYAFSPNEENKLKALHTWAPSWGKSAVEAAGSVPGDLAYNPQTGESDVRRDRKDWLWRHMGGRSLSETKERMQTQALRSENRWNSMMKEKILEQAKGDVPLMLREDKEVFKDYVQNNMQKQAERYVKHGGTVQEFVESLQEKVMKLKISAFERERGLKFRTPGQLQKGKRAQEYQK